MASPSERYAAARIRAAYPETERFSAGFDFQLDDFQVTACAAVEAGRGVLVAAPTGAGKTVVGEFAVHLALAQGRKCFYTTPIKALSNQKYADLVRRYGADRVGLLTGDSSVNGEAPVVVMTTEVLRNMMYAGSTTLEGLGYVVMDEVHYLADRFRGAVWEEVIIHLPREVQVVSLSATVSNAEEFGAWLGTVRGEVDVVVSEHRPVPLWQHMMVGGNLYDLFVDDGGSATTVNPDLLEAIRGIERSSRGRDATRYRREDAGAPRGRRGRQVRGRAERTERAERSSGVEKSSPRHGSARTSRADVIRRLDRDALLPAITFIFSRVGCDAAVTQLLTSGVRLIDDLEGEQVRRTVEERVAGLATDDLAVLGYWEFVEGLSRGFAAHHAGMLPTFREIVEELFTAGRIRAVFATETLALGINMPARTVVLEKLVKFNGETHAEVTPAEYTQLTGRAGRRGIDVEGHAVVQWSPGLDPLAVGGLASTRTYPLRSSFRPTYNMAVNLVARVGRVEAMRVLETSFAQFQADRSVVGMSTQITKHEEALAGYAEAMECHLGDFAEYAALRARISAAEKGAVRERTANRRAGVARSLEELRVGDVVLMPGRRAERAVVVAASRGHKGEAASPGVVTEDGRFRRLVAADVDAPMSALSRVDVPRNFNSRNATARRDLATTLRVKVPFPPPAEPSRAPEEEVSVTEREVAQLRRQLKAHPCHQCPDREHHARWAERWHRLQRENLALRRRVDSRTSTVAKQFDRICDMLVRLGYLDDVSGRTTITSAGEQLSRIYTERDLLTSECLRRGIWAGLDAPSLAAAVSCLIHEPRRDDAGGVAPRMPNDDVIFAHDAMVRVWSNLEDAEAEHSLPQTSYPDPGIAWMMHRWAAGQRLDTVLRDSSMSAGDFVRRCKQLVDLLDQIAGIAPPDVAASAKKAIDGVLRGVVAADRLD